jgi:hypothetical protein
MNVTHRDAITNNRLKKIKYDNSDYMYMQIT